MISEAYRRCPLTDRSEFTPLAGMRRELADKGGKRLFYFSLVDNGVLAPGTDEPGPRGARLTGIAKL
jgi:hypothetical protein